MRPNMSTPIPKVPGVPLLGNINDIDPNNTWDSLRVLAEKYGEIFQIKILGKTLVLVAGAELVGEVCDETRFRKWVGGPIVEMRHAVHDSLFTAFDHEPSWAAHHAVLVPLLAKDAAESWFVDMRDTALELCAMWAKGKATAAESELDPMDGLNRLNLEATTLALYGMRLHGLTGPAHAMIGAMELSTSEAIKRGARPALVNRLLGNGKLDAATRVMRAYAASVVEHRRAHPPATLGRRDDDVLAALLAAEHSGLLKGPEAVIDELVTMPIGSSTAPCVVAAALYFLARDPTVLARLRAEVDDVLGPWGGAEISTKAPFEFAHLAHLPYAAAVVGEALRLSAAAPGFNVEPVPRANAGDKTPVLLGGGRYAIAHDQAMVVVLMGANRDAAVFGDTARTFDPDRHLGGRFEAWPLGARRWFGNGKRECIGKEYAWQWCLVVLVLLIRELEFELVDPDYQMRQEGWFNIHPVGLRLRVRERAK